MPFPRLAVALVWIALLPALAAAAAPTTSPSDPVPRPPMQDQPWTPPKTELPATLLSATDLLFKQGMADPRGCEYREIVARYNGWSGPEKTHGWVLPAVAGQTQRFAVCWNGLVYPLVSVGKPADVKTDVTAMIANDRIAMAEERKQFSNSVTVDRAEDRYERGSLEWEHFDVDRVCLLLRAGRMRLAEQYWDELLDGGLAAPATQPSDAQKQFSGDPYLKLADQWAWIAYQRALSAHGAGDHAVALAMASLLVQAEPQIERTAADRHFPRPYEEDGRTGKEIPNPPYLRYFDQVKLTLGDERHRASEGKIDRVLDYPREYPGKAQRIAGLIRDLEDAHEDADMIIAVPIAAALVDQGEDAVGPLIDCIAHDDRLTRILELDNHNGEIDGSVSVSQVAYGILREILGQENYGPITRYDWMGRNRAALATELSQWWQKNKDIAPAERRYRTLADDSAGAKQWLEAGQWIVEPTNVQALGFWTTIAPIKPGEVPPMRGAALRAKNNPSVSELFARRAAQMAASGVPAGGGLFEADDAARAALDLSKWDMKAAVPVLQAQLAQVIQVEAAGRGQNSQEDMLLRDAADLFSALENAGNSAVCRQYAQWIRTLPVPESPFQDGIFQPLWQKPNDPDIAGAAEWLFNDPASPWQCLEKPKNPFHEFGDLLRSPLLGMPAFQKNVLRNLRDQSATPEDGNRAPPNDPLAPKAGEKPMVRVCDWYADALGRVEGSAQFQTYWPKANRDAAIALDIQFVHDWANRFAWNSTQSALFQAPFNSARMIFARHDLPATDAEVKAHTAIFSLGGGNVRVVPIEPFPRETNWVTLKRFVEHGQSFNPKTGVYKFDSWFDQHGWILQAEERLENGKWKRYYGFVGDHIVAMVPAEEIEFVKPVAPATQP